MNRRIHTYSIVARDPKTGEMGVAVQSHWFSVGPLVPWAEAGVGAIATQSFVDPAYGLRGLELMRSGMSAPDTLKSLLLTDKGDGVRQVAMIDVKGRVGAHTGGKCIEWAGHQTGKNYSVQANMMLNSKVVPSMAKAFEGRKGSLPDRLLGALVAAQEAGGDIRGRQSAALLVVKGKSTGKPWSDRVVELRVEDHETPLKELKRLITIHRAYQHMNAGDTAIENAEMKEALKQYATAQTLVPDNLEIVYWNAVTLATNKHVKEAVPLFKKVFAKDKNWIELTRRLSKPGIMNPDLVTEVLSRAGAQK